MVATTRERALDAAVELLGESGIRALSHARVDARAGLPPGSTSNWFRTRRALLAGIVDRIAEQERADADLDALSSISGLAGLVDGVSTMIDLQSGAYAARTRARYALFLELAHDAELVEPLHRQRRIFETLVEGVLTNARVVEPMSATQTFLALGDGLLLHRVTVDPTLDVRGALTRLVGGFVAS